MVLYRYAYCLHWEMKVIMEPKQFFLADQNNFFFNLQLQTDFLSCK